MAADQGWHPDPPNQTDIRGISMATANYTPEVRLCSVDGCAGKRHGRGYCQKHYKRLIRNGSPLKGGWPVRAATCAVDDCMRKPRTRDMCDWHYRRWKRHGDPLKTLYLVGVSPDVRFESKLRPVGDCLEWQGCLNHGYGQMGVDGVTVLAHRYAWARVNGPIPDGLFVCHKCDNPPCCNVDHLFLGTHQDNMDDMVAKGRQRNGPSRKNTSKR